MISYVSQTFRGQFKKKALFGVMTSEVSKDAQILCLRPEARGHSRAGGSCGREGCHVLETRKQKVIGRDKGQAIYTLKAYHQKLTFSYYTLPPKDATTSTIVHQLRTKPRIHDEHIRHFILRQQYLIEMKWKTIKLISLRLCVQRHYKLGFQLRNFASS